MNALGFYPFSDVTAICRNPFMLKYTVGAFSVNGQKRKNQFLSSRLGIEAKKRKSNARKPLTSTVKFSFEATIWYKKIIKEK